MKLVLLDGSALNSGIRPWDLVPSSKPRVALVRPTLLGRHEKLAFGCPARSQRTDLSPPSLASPDVPSFGMSATHRRGAYIPAKKCRDICATRVSLQASLSPVAS